MTTMTEQRPETGWLPTTPIGDTVLRRFVHSQAAVNEIAATAVGGRAERTDDVFLADTGGAVPYLNQAVLTHPLTGPQDPALGAVESFFASTWSARRPATLLSVWPTPDLAPRGWTLVGHPAMVLRAPAAVDAQPAAHVEVRVAASDDDFAAAERIAIEGYPLDDARGLPRGSLFPPALAGTDMVVRIGLLDGEPVAVGNVVVAHGVVNLCLGATLPAARRRGVWEALVWARVNEDTRLPAVAYTSDYSRPGFRRMGFLPISRFTLWVRRV